MDASMSLYRSPAPPEPPPLLRCGDCLYHRPSGRRCLLLRVETCPAHLVVRWLPDGSTACLMRR